MPPIKFYFSVAIDLIHQRISFFDNDVPKKSSKKKNYISLLEEYLHNPKLDLADIVGMASDVLLAGVDTVSKFIVLKRYSFVLQNSCSFYLL